MIVAVFRDIKNKVDLNTGNWDYDILCIIPEENEDFLSQGLIA